MLSSTEIHYIEINDRLPLLPKSMRLQTVH